MADLKAVQDCSGRWCCRDGEVEKEEKEEEEEGGGGPRVFGRGMLAAKGLVFEGGASEFRWVEMRSSTLWRERRRKSERFINIVIIFQEAGACFSSQCMDGYFVLGRVGILMG